MNKKRLAIFVGYDRDNIIDDCVVFYLKELNKVADVIFAYDTVFSDEELKKIDGLSIHNICIRHEEYDFGSYKNGYIWAKEQGILENYDTLIFCNDSVYGPFSSFEDIFSKYDQRDDIDFWGVFANHYNKLFKMKTEHLQSYFLVFKKQVFLTELFDNFITGIKKLKNKQDIIDNYEIGLSQLLLKNGFKYDSLFKNSSSMPHDNNALKLVKKGFPFFKTSLFTGKDLCAGCKKIYRYKIFENVYPVDAIQKHAVRISGNKTFSDIVCKRFD